MQKNVRNRDYRELGDNYVQRTGSGTDREQRGNDTHYGEYLYKEKQKK